MTQHTTSRAWASQQHEQHRIIQQTPLVMAAPSQPIKSLGRPSPTVPIPMVFPLEKEEKKVRSTSGGGLRALGRNDINSKKETPDSSFMFQDSRFKVVGMQYDADARGVLHTVCETEENAPRVDYNDCPPTRRCRPDMHAGPHVTEHGSFQQH